MKLIIGLGNPGQKYQNTRHNLGFMAVEEYAKKNLGPKITWEIDEKFKAEILKLNPDLWLIKPQTFMNKSGLSVSAIVNYFKVSPNDLIIIHDDLDLVLGKIRVRKGGAAGGHHGVESIIDSLNTPEFIRLRLGIGNERSHSGENSRIAFNAEKFVVDEFLSNEKSSVKTMLKKSIEALDLLLLNGLEETQNQFN